MFCLKCGKELNEKTKFCPYCGTDQNEVVENESMDTSIGEEEVMDEAVMTIPGENAYESIHTSDEIFVKKGKTHRNMIIAGVVVAIIVIAGILSWILLFPGEKGELGDISFSLSNEWNRDEDDSVFYINDDNRMTFEVQQIQKDTLQWMIQFERAVIEEMTDCSADNISVAGQEAISYRYTGDNEGVNTDAMTVIFSYNKNLYILRLLDKQKSGDLPEEMSKIIETIKLKDVEISLKATEEYEGLYYEPFPEGWTGYQTDQQVAYAPESATNPNNTYGLLMVKQSNDEAFSVMNQLSNVMQFREFNVFVGGKRAKFYVPQKSIDGYSYAENVIIPIGDDAYNILFVTDKKFSTENVLMDFLASVVFKDAA